MIEIPRTDRERAEQKPTMHDEQLTDDALSALFVCWTAQPKNQREAKAVLLRLIAEARQEERQRIREAAKDALRELDIWASWASEPEVGIGLRFPAHCCGVAAKKLRAAIEAGEDGKP